ncbi:hypothetical protein [Marinicella gelatinilytica]|uniref:hypothetical protein n=1 Tax=Marinicella gelatinilytica TaxID=2996017 RepID=UPI00226091CB|nr:hypothetical protein [Marinicella gelatinilytica]MCX7546308.1 hypothetical protein [Marinicella gelatinilytica]
MLKGFVGSLLWRISASNLMEFKKLRLSNQYFNLISQDLLNDGGFKFIDAVIFFLTSEMHSIFNAPKRVLIPPFEATGNSKLISGWKIEMPNIVFYVFNISFDLQKNRLFHYWKIPSKANNKLPTSKASNSLDATNLGYSLIIPEIFKSDRMIDDLINILESHKVKRDNTAKP